MVDLERPLAEWNGGRDGKTSSVVRRRPRRHAPAALFSKMSKPEKNKSSRSSEKRKAIVCLILLITATSVFVFVSRIPTSRTEGLEASTSASESLDGYELSRVETKYKTTAVIVGYSTDRAKNHEHILTGYGDMDRVLDKVLFIWNNQDHPPPKVPADAKVPILVLPQSKNTLLNRFGDDVTGHTDTDSVVIVDDDVYLSEDLFRSMIDTWYLSDPKNATSRAAVGIHGDGRIVGQQMRYSFPCDNSDLSRASLSGWFGQMDCWKSTLGLERNKSKDIDGKKVNMAVGKTILFSKEHLFHYQNDRVVWDFVNSNNACDDIVLNAVIRNSTARSPIFVRQRGLRLRGLRQTAADSGGTRIDLVEGAGMSAGNYLAKLKWVETRRDCVRWTEGYFGEGVWL